MDAINERLVKYSGRYTNYAIYIDDHIKDIVETGKNPEVEQKVYDYIYRICYVLACKGGYFQKFEDYDDFARYAAGEFYIMFRNKYLYKGELRRGKEVEPVKSSLNLIKSVLYAFKVEYIKRFFNDVYNSSWDDEESTRKQMEDKRQFAIGKYVHDSVKNDYSFITENAIKETFSLLPKVIREVVETSPYAKDPLTTNRLYKTCLLSFLNSVTLCNKKAKKTKSLNVAQLSKEYKKESSNCIILWHLNRSMAPQVDILLSRIRSKMASELSDDMASSAMDEDTLNDILATAYSNYDSCQEGS